MLSSIALRYFAEVARCGSLRTAAENLFVASSAVSRQLGLLEGELGTALFERARGRTSMRLTPAGEILMSLVENLEAEEERVRSAMYALKFPARRTIRIGMNESLARDFMPSFLQAFRQRHTDVEFQVHVAPSTRLLELLRDDELDVALAFNALMVSGVRAVYERSLAACVVVSDGHPLAARTSVTLEDCAGYPMALPDVSMDLTRVNDEVFARARLRPERALVTNSYELLRRTCAAGLAVAVLSEPLSRRVAEKSPLRYVPLLHMRPRSFAVFLRRGEQLLPAAKALVEELVQSLRDAEGESQVPRKRPGRSHKGNISL